MDSAGVTVGAEDRRPSADVVSLMKYRPGLVTRVLPTLLGVVGMLPGCKPEPVPNPGRLQTMPTVDLTIRGQQFRCWIARTPDDREVGLMQVTAEQMAPLPEGPERGMLFVFPGDQPRWRGFWMKNTIIPLDIAFLRSDGVIVGVRTMVPLDLNSVGPDAPYRYALEVNANLFQRLGIIAGDKVELPASISDGAS